MFRYTCKKDKFNKTDIQKFPNITLTSIELNYTFNFCGEDLFYEKNGQIYFHIVAKPGRTDEEWIFGRIFLLKYQLIFENDKKQIGLYKKAIQDNNITTQSTEHTNNDDDNTNGNYIYIIIISILVLIMAIGGGILIYKIYSNKNRKKRADELDDDFIYESKA